MIEIYPIEEARRNSGQTYTEEEKMIIFINNNIELIAKNHNRSLIIPIHGEKKAEHIAKYYEEAGYEISYKHKYDETGFFKKTKTYNCTLIMICW